MSTDSTLNETQNTQLRLDALEYHRSPTRGKIEVVATKPLSNQREGWPCLGLAPLAAREEGASGTCSE